jgi:DNA-binding GntR family transcriptional regulator
VTKRATPPTSDTLQVPTLTEETVRALRERILAGEFMPGERLVEEQLSERFGVSRPPLREALRILSQDGLIVGIPRRGFSVAALTPAEVRELYDFRFALERSAVELAMPLQDEDALDPLVDAVDRMRSRVAQKSRDEMLEANSAFHSALVGLAGNRWLDEAFRTVTQQIKLCMAMNLRFRQEMYHDPDDVVRRHQEIVDLIVVGDAQAVLQALATHGDRSFMDRLDTLLDAPQGR